VPLVAEPLVDEPIFAFVSLNCSPPRDVELDAELPEVADPEVPVVPLIPSAAWRQPVTVMVFCPD
jgi:hypothetical protein